MLDRIPAGFALQIAHLLQYDHPFFAGETIDLDHRDRLRFTHDAAERRRQVDVSMCGRNGPEATDGGEQTVDASHAVFTPFDV